MSNEERVTHFGPIYGRPTGMSMSLCRPTTLQPGESNTMSRALGMVTCKPCLETIERVIDSLPYEVLVKCAPLTARQETPR